MGIARRTSALRRGLMLQAADREAGQGRIDAALARLAKASASPDIETRRVALQAAARLTAAAGRAEDAAEHLRNVVRLDDSDPAAWRALALHAEEMAAYPEAVYAWGRVITLTSDTAALRLRIAALVERYGDRDARIEAWQAAAVAAAGRHSGAGSFGRSAAGRLAGASRGASGPPVAGPDRRRRRAPPGRGRRAPW